MSDNQDGRDYLSAVDILNSDDLEFAELEIPEWGGTLRVRVLSADEAIKFQDIINNPQQRKSAWVRILSLCAVDADGKRLFSERDLDALRKKSTKVFLRLQKFLMELNGFSDSALENAKNG